MDLQVDLFSAYISYLQCTIIEQAHCSCVVDVVSTEPRSFSELRMLQCCVKEGRMHYKCCVFSWKYLC